MESGVCSCRGLVCYGGIATTSYVSAGWSVFSQGQDSKTYLWGGRFVLRGRLARLTCGGGSVCSQGQVSKTYLWE